MDEFASLRQSLRRDDARWYYTCRLRSLGAWSLKALDWVGRGNLHSTGVMAACLVEDARPSGSRGPSTVADTPPQRPSPGVTSARPAGAVDATPFLARDGRPD